MLNRFLQGAFFSLFLVFLLFSIVSKTQAACSASWSAFSSPVISNYGPDTNSCGPNSGASLAADLKKTMVSMRTCLGQGGVCAGTETCDGGNGNFYPVWDNQYVPVEQPYWSFSSPGGLFASCIQASDCDTNAGILNCTKDSNNNVTCATAYNTCLTKYDYEVAATLASFAQGFSPQTYLYAVNTVNLKYAQRQIYSSIYPSQESNIAYSDNTVDTFIKTYANFSSIGAFCRDSRTAVRVPLPGICFPAPANFEAKPGLCGSANGTTVSTAPTVDLCSLGTASAVTGNGPWNWTCYGFNGSGDSSCSANSASVTNGVCGSANGVAVSLAPTSNLCNTGTASAVTGNGPWNWTCIGTGNGHINSSCNAPTTASLIDIIVTPTSQIINVGSGALYNVELDISRVYPRFNFLKLSVTNCPTGATCTFNKNNLTLDGDFYGYVTNRGYATLSISGASKGAYNNILVNADIDGGNFEHASANIGLTVNGPPTCSSTGPSGVVTSSVSGVLSVYAYGVSAGVTNVLFPTWGETNGQNDIIWYPGTNLGNGTWRANIDLSKHAVGSPEYGNIFVHTYMSSPGFVNVFCGTAASFVRVRVPTVDLKINGLDISLSSPLAVPRKDSTSINLSWTATDATSCTATKSGGAPGIWTGIKNNISGIESLNFINISGPHTYTVSCTGPGGLATDTVYITVPVCNVLNFISGSVTPNTIAPSGSYSLTCDYGVVNNQISPVVSSGSCVYTGFTNTAANFSCVAGSAINTFSNNCSLSGAQSPDYYCASNDPVNNLTVAATCPVGGVTLSPTTVNVGSSVVASAPSGWSGGIFSSSNAGVASVSGSTVNGLSAGTSNIVGSNWKASNGATNCSLTPGSLTVTALPPPPVAPTIALSTSGNVFTGVSGSGSTVPSSQTLTIRNSGGAGSNLLYRVQTNQPWCRVNGVNNSGSITGGPLAQNVIANVSVTMSPPSNTGSFICTVTVSDNGSSPAATNSPQSTNFTYTVTPSNPSNVTAGVAVCPSRVVIISWTASVPVGTTYTLYRNTVNNSAAATAIATNINTTSRTDSPPVGSSYYYWVEANSGGQNSSRVSASGNPVNVSVCVSPPAPPALSPPPSNSGVNCTQIKISLVDNSNNEQGFRIYRSSVDDANATGPAIGSVNSTSVASTGTVYQYIDTTATPGIPYYYWATAYTGVVESAKSGGGTSVVPLSCDADLGGSNKDVTQVNSVTPPGYLVDTCGVAGSQTPPGIVYKIGDTISYQINLCAKNTQGGYSATKLVMVDTMSNLGTNNGTTIAMGATTAQLIAAYNMSVTLPLHIKSVSVVNVDYPNTVKLNIDFVPSDALAPGSSAVFSMKAKTALPANFTGDSSRFQNGMSITYDKDGSGPGSATNTNRANTPWLMFRKDSAPTKIEVAP